MKRIYMTMDEKEMKRFDKACGKAGLTRSQYLTCLLSGRIDLRPPVLRYKEMIRELSNIERDLKVIALKDGLSEDDKVMILTKLSDIKDVFAGITTEKGEGSDGTEG